jgi:hypothetical protein
MMFARTSSPRSVSRALLASLALSLTLASSASRAQSAPSDAAALTDATAAQSAHPIGIADRPGEAPGSTGLVALPGESLPRVEQRATDTASDPASDPASDRAMAFNAGGGQCRDTIPGGPILAAAYACILALLGLYAFSLGRRNATLTAQLDELEKRLARAGERGGAARE